VEGKSVDIVARSSEGEKIEKTMALEDLQFAKIMGTRQAIKNYNAMINCETYKVDTIFSSLPFEANRTQITFSGCGALNPFQNDPRFETFGVGTPILVNGSIGYLIGPEILKRRHEFMETYFTGARYDSEVFGLIYV